LRSAYRTGSGCITLQEQRAKLAQYKNILDNRKAEEQKQNITLDDFYQKHFKNMSESNVSANTFRSESGYYRNWLLPNLGNTSLNKISLGDLEHLKQLMVSEQKHPRTINYVFGILSKILSYAQKMNYLHGDLITSQFKKLKYDNKRMRFLTHKEADLLLDGLRKWDQQLYEISLLSLHCGLRAGEIFSLCWSDVDLENRILTLRNTKNTKTRNLYMTDDVYYILSQKKAKRPQGSLVFTQKDGSAIKGVSHAFAKVVSILKLNDGITDDRQKVVFHTLRHTYASWLAQMGTNLYTVQQLLGHSSFVMTQRYAHLSPETLKKAVLNFEERLKNE
jgi:integrase